MSALYTSIVYARAYTTFNVLKLSLHAPMLSS